MFLYILIIQPFGLKHDYTYIQIDLFLNIYIQKNGLVPKPIVRKGP
jgi:hypothetical protein